MNKILMKVPIFLLATAIFLVSVPALTHASKIGVPTNFLKMNQTLTGWWTMDGNHTTWPSSGATTTSDISGNARTGTLNGFTQTTAIAPGKIGQAISFSGSNYISLTNALSNFMSAATGTISVWLRPSTGNSGTCADNTASAIFVDGTASGGYMFLSHDGTNVCGGAWDGDYQVVSTAASVGQWTHAVWVHSLGNLYLYKNGVLAGQTPLGNITDLTHAVWMGRSIGNVYFNGRLDDIRAWSNALSATDIAQLYTATRGSFIDVSQIGGGTLNQGLVGWWTLDGPTINVSTGIVLDKSGSLPANNGQMTGFAGATSSAQMAGKIGQGLKFDGVDDYIEINNNPYTIANAKIYGLTFSAWIKIPDALRGYTSYDGIVGGAGDAAHSGYSAGGIYHIIGASASVVGMQIFDGSYKDAVVDYSDTLSANRWYFVVGIFDPVAAEVRIYLNGVYKNSASVTVGGVSFDPDVFRIGSHFSTDYPYFKDNIDDVRVYNRALTTTEITQLYKMGR